MDRDIVANTLGAAAMRLLELRLTKLINISPPAVGANFAIKVPGGVMWELLGAHVTVSTSAVAATRLLKLEIQDQDANEIGRYSTSQSQVASTTLPYTWDAGIGEVTSATGINSSLPNPPKRLMPGWSISSFISAMDPGDSITQASLHVVEWSESDVLQEMRIIAQQMTSQVMDEIYS